MKTGLPKAPFEEKCICGFCYEGTKLKKELNCIKAYQNTRMLKTESRSTECKNINADMV
jgi:hypothetical protein